MQYKRYLALNTHVKLKNTIFSGIISGVAIDSKINNF